MNYTIYLTKRCNLDCSYCYEKNNKCNGDKDVSIDTLKKFIDNEICSSLCEYSFITFYGGEPLLKLDVIKEVIDYIKNKKIKTKVYFNITTNGLLLTKDVLKYMKKNNFVTIAISIDGIKESHDANRITKSGEESFEIVHKNANLLLKNFKNAVAMCVITKNNLEHLPENINYLYDMGFKNINLLFDYTSEWNDSDLEVIKKQFNKVSDFYIEKMLQNKDINIPLFTEKIKSYINDGFDCNELCEFCSKRIHVGVDGRYYPCSQFTYKDEFCIGSIEHGVDNNLINNLIEKNKKEHEECSVCKIKNRCKHKCACKNYIITGKYYEVPALVCEIEKIFIECADKIMETLYLKNCKQFIKKFYK